MKLREAIKNNKVILCIFLIFALYLTGGILMEPIDMDSLAEKGVISAECESDNSIIEISGVGSVLTYRNVYCASFLMLFIVPLIGIFLYKKGSIGGSDTIEQIGWIIFANCILGVLLLPLTSKGNILSTVLFWLGIFTANFLRKIDRKESKTRESGQ